jgi:hypothetical protein
MVENKILEKALQYCDKKWFVFPCREKSGEQYTDKKGKLKIPKEKTPYTPNGFKDATLDKNIINSWWKKYPDAMIGISCGDSNIFVIDVDTKHGKDGMNNYMKLGIDDSKALHSLTPSGGLHIIFSGTGRSTTDIMNGVDTRGIGGYFIAPPSCVLEGETTGNYVALDDWNRIPDEIPSDLLYRLHVAKERKKYNSNLDNYQEESKEIIVQRAKLALSKLPERMAESYSQWIDVGLSLYSLGIDGLLLWDNWSKLSSKYKSGECENKWETFKPDEINIASLFFWAKYNEE